MSLAAALRSTPEPRRACRPKSASTEIFRNRRASQGRSAAYRFVASRDFAYAYEKPRQDRQSLQTDPVGYEDDLNLYAYVRNDPLNMADPTGMRHPDEVDEPPVPEPPPQLTEQQERDLNNLTIGVLGAPILAIGCAMGGCEAAAAGTLARLAITGIGVGGAAGAAVEGGEQLVTDGQISDWGAVGDSFEQGASSGVGAAFGGRIAGTPGAMIGSYVGAIDEGASQEEAAWGAAGAGLARLLIPAGPDGARESFGAGVGRQFFRSAFGKEAGRAGHDLTDEQRR